MFSESIEEKLALWAPEKAYPEQWDWASIEVWLSRLFNARLDIPEDQKTYLRPDALREIITEKIGEAYKKRESDLTTPVLRHIERMILLQMIDTAWKEHLYDLDQIKKGIGLRAYGQKDPKIEYQKESFAMFEQMMHRIREATIEYIFRIQLVQEPVRRPVAVAAAPASTAPVHSSPRASATPAPAAATIPVRGNEKAKSVDQIDKIGRNDPCPCGSGKKYKKCCGAK